MKIDPELREASPAVLLASALHLLSASALNGPNVARSQALLNHLYSIAENEGMDPLLRQVCQELLQTWQFDLAECSVCAQGVAGSVLH